MTGLQKEFEGFPVVVNLEPPRAVVDGRAHIAVTVGMIVRSAPGKAPVTEYDSVIVRVYGERALGLRWALVYQEYGRKTGRVFTDPQPWLDVARAHLPAAALTLAGLDAAYAAAYARLRQLDAFPGPLSRDAYEVACDVLGVVEWSDERLSDSYGVKFVEFAYPEHSADVCVEMALAQLRWAGIEREILDRKIFSRAGAARGAAARPAPTGGSVRPQGQLWEPCERCGAEPVYMPAMRCQRCWPGGWPTGA